MTMNLGSYISKSEISCPHDLKLGCVAGSRPDLYLGHSFSKDTTSPDFCIPTQVWRFRKYSASGNPAFIIFSPICLFKT